LGSVGMIAVKLSPEASNVMNELFSPLSSLLTGQTSINYVDPTDLYALPVVWVSYIYGKRKIAIEHD